MFTKNLLNFNVCTETKFIFKPFFRLKAKDAEAHPDVTDLRDLQNVKQCTPNSKWINSDDANHNPSSTTINKSIQASTRPNNITGEEGPLPEEDTLRLRLWPQLPANFGPAILKFKHFMAKGAPVSLRLIP